MLVLIERGRWTAVMKDRVQILSWSKVTYSLADLPMRIRDPPGYKIGATGVLMKPTQYRLGRLSISKARRQ